jgi:hypothetical protein
MAEQLKNFGRTTLNDAGGIDADWAFVGLARS